MRQHLQHVLFSCFMALSSSPMMAAPQSIHTAAELDKLQAQLNTQWARVEEIGTAHGALRKIRQEKILGAYFLAVDAWHKDAQIWMDGWQPIARMMEGTQLASDVKQVEIQNLLKAQAIGIEKLRQRIPGVVALGDNAGAALDQLKTFDPKYVDLIPSDRTDSFSTQIGVYNQLLRSTKASLAQARANFSQQLVTGYAELTARASKKAMDKIKALALNFPELKASLVRIEQTLNQMRIVDATVDLLNQESQQISLEFAQDRYYTGKKRLDAFRIRVQAEIGRIMQSSELSETAKTYGRDTLQGILRVRDAQVTEILRTRNPRQILASFYGRSMNGTAGMVQRCMTLPQPKDIDCSRLRVIQGFKHSQLLKINDAAAEYIEEQILRAQISNVRL